MSDWFYAINNEQQGPVSEQELKKMLTEHHLPQDTLIWQQGMESWLPANQAEALQPPTPPPLKKIPPPTTKTELSSISSASSVTSSNSDIEKNKALAVIAYISILFIVTLLAGKGSPFARFHAGQGLTLFLTSLGLMIVVPVAQFILYHLPLFGIFAFALNLFYFVPFVLAVMGIIYACNGKMKKLPLIGDYTLIK